MFFSLFEKYLKKCYNITQLKRGDIMEYIDERLNEINNIDIPTSSETIHFILKDIVNKNYSLEEIDEKCNRLPIYAIIHYLLAYGGEYDSDILNAVRRYYNNLRINDNRCLVISDTHIGRTSEKDDPRYLYRTNDANSFECFGKINAILFFS